MYMGDNLSPSTADESRGPIPPTAFPDGEKNARYKRQQYLDPDGICQVREIKFDRPITPFILHESHVLYVSLALGR